MKEIYDQSITDPSLEELKELARWYNAKIGNYPLIVGGWAVYLYTKGMGSKDIDIIFPGDAAKHETLIAYFLTHGFEERKQGFFEKEFAKTIEAKGGKVDIIIDAASQKRFIQFDMRKVHLPWEWAMKHCIEHKIGNTIVLIPIIELLMVYKLGAILGRNDRMRAGGDIQHYRSKIWKDVYDVVSLSALEIDIDKAKKFLKESGLDRYSVDIMQLIDGYFDEEIRGMLPNATLDKIRKLLNP